LNNQDNTNTIPLSANVASLLLCFWYEEHCLGALMKTAFPYWHNRIAPVFDTACQILIIESEAGLIAGEQRVILPDDEPAVKVLRLVELEIGSLVCGALSRPMFEMATAYGIKVTPFIAGDLDEIVCSWVTGKLKHETYAMPGCRMRWGRRLKDASLLNVGLEDPSPRESSESRCKDGQRGGHPACHIAIGRRKQ
jgi:predicted Fe-Mo cluster-binding NifX family protein